MHDMHDMIQAQIPDLAKTARRERDRDIHKYGDLAKYL